MKICNGLSLDHGISAEGVVAGIELAFINAEPEADQGCGNTRFPLVNIGNHSHANDAAGLPVPILIRSAKETVN